MSFQVLVFIGGIIFAGATSHCTTFPSGSASEQSGQRYFVVGHVRAVLIGPTNRHYEPRVRLIELMHRRTDERVEILLESDRALFMATLAAGDYSLTRVQIHEGPFLSLAQLDASFTVQPDRVTYLGTWRFGVESPRYGRMVVVAAVEDEADRIEAEQEFTTRHPEREGFPAEAALLTPQAAQARLYEVAPYPRIQPYFRRHWW